MTVDTAATTQRGIDILTESIPNATVTGEYDDEVGAWTWAVSVPVGEPVEAAEGTEPYQPKAWSSRQFVPTEEAPEPTDEYLRLVATEIASTLPTGASA